MVKAIALTHVICKYWLADCRLVPIASWYCRNRILFAEVQSWSITMAIHTCTNTSLWTNIKEVVFKDLSEKAAMIIARVSVVLISLVAIFIARDPNSSVFGIVSFAWAGFGAAFGPVVLLALFWKRSNKWGALSGMIAGGVMVFVWKFLVRPLGGAWNIYELLPAFIVAILVNVLVSLLTKAPSKEIVDEFEAVSAELKAEK